MNMETAQTINKFPVSTVNNLGVVTPAAAQQLTDMLGIIFPPPEIKTIIDKTASFVAKNGPEFEQRVLSDTANAQKFSFLTVGNPYRAYYDAKVKEIQLGENTGTTEQNIPQAIVEMKRREEEKKAKKEKLLALTAFATQPRFVTSTSDSQALSRIFDLNVDMSNTTLIDDDRPPAPPPDDQYIVLRPYATNLDIDIIKLTALYVARNGQKFLTGLSQRERGNPLFSFLRTSHPLFSFFASLVDAYSKCLVPEKATISRLKEDIGLEGRFLSAGNNSKDYELLKPIDVLNGNRVISGRQVSAMLNILERVESRYLWESFQEKKKQEQVKKEADERMQMHAIDWHEFSVVEVINFTEEDDALPLGPPLTKDMLVKPVVPPLVSPHHMQYSMDYQNSFSNDMSGNIAPYMGSTPVIPPLPGEVPASVLPMVSLHSSVNPLLTTVPAQGGFSDGPPEPQTPAVAPIVVVKGYVRQGKKRQRNMAGMQKCPITGELIPVEQMSEHLRILLLDPKWKEQKDILLEKAQKESAFAPSTDFEANLANFVAKRPDLFGTVEDECESNYVVTTKRK